MKKKMPLGTSLGERLRALRRNRDLSVSRLAQISGVTQGYISQIETGQRPSPGMNILQALAKALKVSLDELTGFDPHAADEVPAPETEARLLSLEAKTDRLVQSTERLEDGIRVVDKSVRESLAEILEKMNGAQSPSPSKQSRRQVGGSNRGSKS